jgi:hypothetical protein
MTKSSSLMVGCLKDNTFHEKNLPKNEDKAEKFNGT